MRGPDNHQRGFVLLAVVLALTLVAGVAFLLNREAGMGINLAEQQQQTAKARYVAEAGLQHLLWQVRQDDCSGYTDLPSTPFGDHSYSATVTPMAGSPVTISATGTLSDGTSRTITRSAVPIVAAPVTLALQPGAEGKDTWVNFEDPADNYGASTSMVLNGGDQGTFYLLEFDLSAVPAGASVISAELQLELDHMGSADPAAVFTVHRMLKAWTEGTGSFFDSGDGANWYTSDGSSSWSWPDNYEISHPAASTQVDPSFNGPHTWDVTELVAGWADGSFANHGLLLSGNTKVNQAEFYSSDVNQDYKRPQLTVVYACQCGSECGGDDSCDADYAPTTEVADFSTAAYGEGNLQGLTYLPAGKTFNGVTAPADGAWISVDPDDDRFYMTDMAGNLLTSSATPTGSPRGVAYISAGTFVDHLAVVDNAAQVVTYVPLAGGSTISFLTTSFGSNIPAGLGFIENSASGTYDGHLVVVDKTTELAYIVDQLGNLKLAVNVSDGGAMAVQDVSHLPGTDKLIVTYECCYEIVFDYSGTMTGKYDLGAFGVTSPEAVVINPTNCQHVVADKNLDSVKYLEGGGETPEPEPEPVIVALDAVADGWVREGDSTVWGGGVGTPIEVGKNATGGRHRSLVKFDVSAIPAAATVSSATLRLFIEAHLGNQPIDIGAYRVTADWQETTANWFNAGENFDPGVLFMPNVPLENGTWVEWTLPAGLIHEWRDGFTPNYGLLLSFDGVKKNMQAKFASREHATAAWHPQLVVTYAEP